MKLTVVCQKCARVISAVEKDSISQGDIDMYVSNSVCDMDGPFPAQMGQDDDGNPIVLVPAVENDQIVAVKTQE